MRVIIFLLLFPLVALAAQNTTIKAPFAGSDYRHLTKTGTIAEYWMDVDTSGYLIDHSGENLFLYSEQFDQAATWVPTNASATANAYLNPVDGLLTADAFNEGVAAGTTHYLGQSVAVTTGRIYTFSVYAYSVRQTDPTKTRHWISLSANAGAGSAYFNLSACTVGTTSSVTARTKFTGSWCKISITFVSASTSTLAQRIYLAEGDNDVTLDGQNQVAYAIFGAQFVDNTDGVIDREGRYVQTAAASKPRHNLTPTNSPTSYVSNLNLSDNTYWRGRTFNGSNQEYSRTAHASFNILTGDWTITFMFNTLAAGAANGYVFGNLDGTHGIYSRISTSKIQLVFTGGPTDLSTSNISDGYNHVAQWVKTGSVIYQYVDGVKQKGVSSASIDNPTVGFAIGSYQPGGGDNIAFNAMYFRMDSRALSDSEIQSDLQLLRGYALDKPADTNVTFSRASSAYVTLPDGTLVQRMINLPRIGKDGLLLEGDGTNYFPYSQTIGSWSRNNDYVAVTSNTVTAPDGTLTGGTIKEWGFSGGGGATDEHSAGRSAISATDQTYYTFSTWIKPANRIWTSFFIWDSTNGRTQAAAYYNLQTGSYSNVTFFAGGAASAKIVPYANGWWRCSLTFKQVGNSSGDGAFVAVAEAANDRQFAGINQDSLYVWGAQFETGYHETSYIPSTGSNGTRSTDLMTELPYRLNPGNLLTGTETWYTRFDQDVYNTGTVVLGGKTFTQSGDIKHKYTVDERNFYENSATSSLSVTDADFYPGTASFSVVALINFSNVVSVMYAGMNNSTINKRSWRLGTDGTGYPTMYISDNGTSFSQYPYGFVTLVAGKPYLLTLSYTYGAGSTGTVVWYTDDFGPRQTSSIISVYDNTGVPFVIMNDAGGSAPGYGKIHFLSYHKGTALSATDHSNAYTKLFEPGVLPVTLSAAAASTWIDITFDAVCQFSGSTTQGGDRTLLAVGGNINTSASNKNHLAIYITAGQVTGDLYDNATTVHRVQSTVDAFNLSLKHTYRFYVNAADLGSSNFWVDGSSSAFTTRNNVVAGTSIAAGDAVKFKDTLVRYGQTYAGVTTADCSISNLKIKHGN